MRCRPAFPACLRFVFPSSRFISSPVVSPVRLPVLRHGWAGREAGSVDVLLAWFFPAVCADVDRSVHAVGSLRSLGLLACRLGCGDGGGVLISSCGMCCDVLAYRLSARLVSRLVHHPVGRVGSSAGSVLVYLAPSCDTMGGEEGGCVAVAACYLSFLVLISLPPISFPRACLPRGVSRHPSDADGDIGLRSIISAC